ncbi:MAG: nitrite/sulfite reductase [Desulfuromonadales bacterium]|nr:nitrite/sulfite reductase [Desulfuromonadales bacterium]
MTTELRDYRLDGIYRQKQDGFLMQRIKLAAGTISSQQTRMAADIADRFGQGSVHLTSRGNMEIHWLREADLPEIKRRLATVGLTARGACGGAVRGVTCSEQDRADFPLIEALARRIQHHFTGNPRFERLPKKFKIGIEARSGGRRHLIQDAGLVLVRTQDGRGWYDLWVGGGLGREPQPGFLLAGEIVEERIIPLLEAVLRVYLAGAPAGKRLKHLLREIGEEEFRQRLDADPSAHEELPPHRGLAENLVSTTDEGRRLEFHCFAGQLSADSLRQLATFADSWADGVLQVTVNQNIAFQLVRQCKFDQAQAALGTTISPAPTQEDKITLRVCPGSHECRAGLSATRDIAGILAKSMGPLARRLCWALSGCHNSCTQPQLADVGIVTSRLIADDDGQRTPRFDLYRPMDGDGDLNQKTEAALTLEELLATIKKLG